MDTREKIVSAGLVLRLNRPARLIVGFFDPMHAAEVRRLSELCTPDRLNIVVVDDPPDPLMPLRARAELAAALGFIDYVVEGGLPEIPAAEVRDERPAQLERRRVLLDQVVRRQHGA